jgi:hypothetical protein
MSRRKHKSSLLDGDKSLTLEQIAECYENFLKELKDIIKLPQIELDKKDSKYMRIFFKSKSDSHMVISPGLTIKDMEECAGFDKYKTVSLTAINLGLCKDSKEIHFNLHTIHKFLPQLKLGIELFQKAYDAAFKEDQAQIVWGLNVAQIKEVIGWRREGKPSDYGPEYIGKLKVRFEDHDSNKTISIDFEYLTPEQALKLGKFAKEEL